MSDILLKQPAFTAGLPRLYIKVDLNWIILKNFKISALTLRFALRDCGNRTHLPLANVCFLKFHAPTLRGIWAFSTS